jgi:holo-[acyl-carrier protein] synthase
LPWGETVIVGSGIDVIEIARVERALGRRGGRFERRVFTPQEIAACRRFARPAAQFALRFAAKEALMKAVGTGWARGVRWVDIETLSGVGDAPELTLALHGPVADHARRLGAARSHVSVARSRRHAFAVVLLEAGLR